MSEQPGKVAITPKEVAPMLSIGVRKQSKRQKPDTYQLVLISCFSGHLTTVISRHSNLFRPGLRSGVAK